MDEAEQPQSSPGPRVVSLIASATEIVHALGMGENQVGRSHECDWPPGVLDLPKLTQPKFKVSGDSAAIDKAVRDLVAQALAVYEVDPSGLLDVAPDVIVTQDQCVVCAVSLRDVEAAVCQTTGLDTRVISLKPHSLEDVMADIRTVAAALKVEARGEELVSSMQSKLQKVANLTRDHVAPRVAFIEWIEPLMSCGHWMPKLVEISGGHSLFGETGADSPTITWQQLAESDPDVIVVAPCGYEISDTERELSSLTGNPLWPGMRAVANNRVYIADGNAYFNRPGPRLVETAEMMAEMLHPSLCDFGHEGHAYYRLRHNQQRLSQA